MYSNVAYLLFEIVINILSQVEKRSICLTIFNPLKPVLMVPFFGYLFGFKLMGLTFENE